MLIALLNNSVRYRNKANILRQIAEAVDKQLSTQVAAGWGVSPWRCQFIEEASKVPVGAYRLVIFDSADQANALGYHSQDALGNPYGRVFVNPIIANGGTDMVGSLSVSVTVSHEACEMMINPEINCWRHDRGGVLYCQELCDAVQGDFYNIKTATGMVAVSNFLLPAWFDYAPVSGSKFDFMGKLSKPFTMSRGGYTITMNNGRISNKFGSVYAANKFAQDGSKFHEAARSSRVRALNHAERLTPEVVMKSFMENVSQDAKNVVMKSQIYQAAGSSIKRIIPRNALSFLRTASVGRADRLKEAAEAKFALAEEAIKLEKDKEKEVAVAQEDVKLKEESSVKAKDFFDNVKSELVSSQGKLEDYKAELQQATDPKLIEKLKKVIAKIELYIVDLQKQIVTAEYLYKESLKELAVSEEVLLNKQRELEILAAASLKAQLLAKTIEKAVKEAL